MPGTSVFPLGLDTWPTGHQDNIGELIKAQDVDNLADSINKMEPALRTGLLYNVLWFGAKGDGFTDDTPAILATINAAAILGGIVFVPPGTYKITSEILVPSNVSIAGAGSTVSILKWGGTNQTTSAVLHVQNGTGAVNGVDFRNFSIDGNNNFTIGQGAGYGLRLVAVTSSMFKNLKIIACGTQCLRLEANAANSTRFNSFDDILLDICDQPLFISAGPLATGSTDCTENSFNNVTMTYGLAGSTGNGFYLGSADGNTFTHLQMARRAGTGFGMELDCNAPFHGGNVFFQVTGTVTVDSGTVGVDTILAYDMANGEAAPVINGTAKLTWSSDNFNGTGWHLATGLRARGTQGLGYETGAGGAVTQLTSKSTGVTLNTVCGQITMNNASLAAGAAVQFTVTDSAVAATDVVIVNIASGATASSYEAIVDAVAAGSFKVSLRNYSGGALAEAVVLNFAVIKGVTS